MNSPFTYHSLIMGIIEPLSLLPYFRLYCFTKEMIVDVPCCTHMLKGESGHWQLYGKNIQLFGWSKVLPAYINNSWSKQGYYIIGKNENSVNVVSLTGEKGVISFEEAAKLADEGHIFNIATRNIPPLAADCSFVVGKTRYYILYMPVTLARICTLAEVDKVIDTLVMRAKMLGMNIITANFEKGYYFGQRRIYEMLLSNPETLIVPQGFTDISLVNVRPMFHNIVVNNPGFWFAVTNHPLDLAYGSVMIADAYSVMVSSSLLCGLFKARAVHMDVNLEVMNCSKVMLWGSRTYLEDGYTADCYLPKRLGVEELVLYHVNIHGTAFMQTVPYTKIILCDCHFADMDARKYLPKEQVQIISEEEMRKLWDFPPSVFEQRLCIPGV